MSLWAIPPNSEWLGKDRDGLGLCADDSGVEPAVDVTDEFTVPTRFGNC